ncbi:MAG: hypothetical protein IPF41_15835 [Flavobacteriales bacterium]|nr:hypothetical protein [Flavobacteriales bacterium]
MMARHHLPIRPIYAIIRDNVVRDLFGDVESSARLVYSAPICMGIYFGNVFNKKHPRRSTP